MTAVARKNTQLSRSSIISAALELAEKVGVDNLTIRNVAEQLGVTPMALYKHFDNKQELLSCALEEFIGRADVLPAQDLPWEEWVSHVGRRMYVALCRDFSWISVLGSVRLGDRAANVTDAFVKKLSSVGFTAAGSVRAYFSVIQVVFGAVCVQASMRSKTTPNDSVGDLAQATHAYLEHANFERLQIAPDFERTARMEQIDLGLPMIVSAMRRELERTQSTRRR